MIHWMLYALIVALVLGIAALCAERVLRLRQGATRWVWLAAIAASLLVPTLVSSVSFQIPNVSQPTHPQKAFVLRELTSLPVNEWSRSAGFPALTDAPDELDIIVKRGWLLLSFGLLTVLTFSAWQLSVRERGWQRAVVAGAPVYVAPGVGPAVVGLFRPRIVVPSWVAEGTPSSQLLVIAHEQSHLDARDPLLFTTGLALLIFMPWNLPLWWQVHRLRRAIEVDCDARVLAAGHDVTRYGEALLEVGLRQSAFLGTVAAMSESRSFLEQRIMIMHNQRSTWWRSSAALLGGMSVGLVALAVQVTPPNSTAGTHPDASAPRAISVDPSVYDGYVGHYLGPNDRMVFTVSRDAGRLLVRLTGQEAVETFPSSTTEFFYKAVKARIVFDVDAQGRAGSMTLHQNGRQIAARRIDPQRAQGIESALTARVQAQTASPGSDAALRRLYGGLLAGTPDYEAMSPELARATRDQLPQLLAGAQKLGPIQSVEFRGVSPQGADVYDVRHERGRTRFTIGIAADGTLSDALMRPGP